MVINKIQLFSNNNTKSSVIESLCFMNCKFEEMLMENSEMKNKTKS